MKQTSLVLILLVFFFCALTPISTFAQCSIAICKKTGNVGYSWNQNNRYHTMAELREIALYQCQEAGGTHCVIYAEGNNPGWWALIMGTNSKGGDLILGTKGKDSKNEAEYSVRFDYTKNGGVDLKKAKVYSWYVYYTSPN